MPPRPETDARELAKDWLHPRRLKPFFFLLPVAVLGAYVCGVFSGVLRSTQSAGGDLVGLLMPDPFGVLIGFVVFALLGWRLTRRGAALAAVSIYHGLYARFSARGFATGGSAAPGSAEEGEEATLMLADRFVAQVAADRKEAEKYKGALSKYADSSLAVKLGSETHFSTLQTKKATMAVMFTDIRGFTKMCEVLSTEQVVSVLNDYFAFAAEIVHRNGGRINKFVGDAVMALFEDPSGYVTGSQAAKNAAMAGMELVAKFRMQQRIWKERILTPFEADLGCGVHVGPLIFGNMGSPERMEYTAIGDTVNFASRLCSQAHGGQVRISEDCFKMVEGYFEMSPEQPLTLKGKTGEFKTWLVVGKKG